MTFDERPFIAFWEMTRACDLACVHCRASAEQQRDPRELSTAEGKKLLAQFAAAKVPLVVLTGGDPAKRPDLCELVRYGGEIGLSVALTPSSTPLFTNELVRELAAAKLSRMAVSVDGADAGVHDAFRGVHGSFAEALRILRAAREAGLQTQVNTTVHAGSLPELERIAARVGELGSVLWSVFFVVPTGRANADMVQSADLVEDALVRLAELAERVPFVIKTTAAPHYRRVLLQRRKAGTGHVNPAARGREAFQVNDGRGLLFVSHRGEVCPSGFLPIVCGDARLADPIAVFKYHPTFRALRDSSSLTGKCAACEYRNVCGGSRARAYALTGSLFASDPSCAYVPPGYVERIAEPPRRRLSMAR